MYVPETEDAMESKPMYSDVNGKIVSSSDMVIAHKKQKVLSKDEIKKRWRHAPTTHTLWCFVHNVRYQVFVPESEWKISEEKEHAPFNVEKKNPKDTETTFSLKPKS